MQQPPNALLLLSLNNNSDPVIFKALINLGVVACQALNVALKHRFYPRTLREAS